MCEQENVEAVLFFSSKSKCDVYEQITKKKKHLQHFLAHVFIFLQQEECKIYLQHCQQVILNKYLGINT